MTLKNSADADIELEAVPESSQQAIRQLLVQLERRNQRLSLVRQENEQLTQQLAQRDHALEICQSQIKVFGLRDATVVEALEASARHQERIRIREQQTTEMQGQTQELQILSAQLVEKEGIIVTLSAQLAEHEEALRRLSTQVLEKLESFRECSIRLAGKERDPQTLSAEPAEQNRALQTRVEPCVERTGVLSAKLPDTENSA